VRTGGETCDLGMLACICVLARACDGHCRGFREIHWVIFAKTGLGIDLFTEIHLREIPLRDVLPYIRTWEESCESPVYGPGGECVPPNTEREP
jgi:hypothetical protein